MNISPNTTIDDLLKLIYGKDVVENAYASPAGRLTKKQAKTQLESLITAAKIEELKVLAHYVDYEIDDNYPFATIVNHLEERVKELESFQESQ
jgi:hypothetical protein